MSRRDRSDDERFREEERRMNHVQDLPGMGYWQVDYLEGPEARSREVMGCVAPMTEGEIQALVSYMDAGVIGIQWRGIAMCRICGEMLGSACMTTPDDKWRFPERWQHYITEHGVRPPEEFIRDALAWSLVE